MVWLITVAVCTATVVAMSVRVQRLHDFTIKLQRYLLLNTNFLPALFMVCSHLIYKVLHSSASAYVSLLDARWNCK